MKRFLLTALAALALSAPLQAQTTTTGLVSVKLPRDARLYVDEVFCPLPGALRSFETPPLDPGKRYYYTLLVEITVDGKPVRASKRADVEAGKRTDIDFGDRATIAAIAATPPAKPAVETGSASLPQGFPPLGGLAELQGEFLIVTKPVFVEEKSVEEKIRDVGGKTEFYKVEVTKRVAKPVSEKVALSWVKAIEAPGTDVSTARLRQLLAKPANVLMVYDSRVDPVYLRSMKDGTLILLFPQERTPGIKPGIPVPVPPPVDPDEPRAGTPPMIVNASFKDGFIVWKTTVPEEQEYEEKVTVKSPDGKETVKTVRKTKIVMKEIEARVDARKSIVATVGGKTVDLAELAKRLEKPTLVILSYERIAPFHLQLYEEDTLTIVAPPEPLPVPRNGPKPDDPKSGV